MTIVLNGDTGLIVSGNTNTLAGVTVGQGAGAVSSNTAVGASALAANTTGTVNTAVGASALAANTTGSANIAVGRKALFTNVSGGSNVAVGEGSLELNTAGSNTALGHNASTSNTTGANNTSVGYQALLFNTTASNNTAVGYQAGYSNTTGIENVFLGDSAGYSNTTGVRAVCIGKNAGYAGTPNRSVFIGWQAGYNTTGLSNTFIGTNYAYGTGAGAAVTSGAKNTIIGGYDGNMGGLDIRTASNYIVLSDGDGNPRAWWSDSGNVRMPATYANTTGSAANMVIDSAGLFARSTSALKYKQDIRDLESMDISLLRPVRYKSKCDIDDQTKDHLGLIADEAADAGFEELVSRGADGEVEGFQYERLTVILLKELQMLLARVAQLESNP